MKKELINKQDIKIEKSKLIIIFIVICLIAILTKLNNYNKDLLDSKNSNILAVKIQENEGGSTYKDSSTLPDGTKYEINESKSYCYTKTSKEHDTKIRLYTNDKGQHVMENLAKNNKCYLYFDLKTIIDETVATMSVADILAKYTKDNSRSGEITAPFAGKTPNTIYSKEDDDGTSYIFAGVDPNNWIKLGNLYFRILRFNGNGSLRLIYSGEGNPIPSGSGSQISQDLFNSAFNDNAYVGLQYTVGENHGNTKNSNILGESNSTINGTLYNWYNLRIKPKYSSIVDKNVGFCSNRDAYTNSAGTTSGGGTGTTETYYGGYIKYVKNDIYQTSYTPQLKCQNSLDRLKLPVGLITADEYMLAGGGANKSGHFNTTFWLHTGGSYWTMTPSHFNSSNGYAYMFTVYSDGYLHNSMDVASAQGIRPIINLKSSTEFLDDGADGSALNPFVVKPI